MNVGVLLCCPGVHGQLSLVSWFLEEPSSTTGSESVTFPARTVGFLYGGGGVPGCLSKTVLGGRPLSSLNSRRTMIEKRGR